MSIDRGEGHPANRGTSLPEAPQPPVKAPAGMRALAAAINQRRLPDRETGRLGAGLLVLECGPLVTETLAAYTMRPEYVPDPVVAPGKGLTFRAVGVHLRDGWGGRWRLLDDGEIACQGQIVE